MTGLEDFPPEGWPDWSPDRRRIWRLEQKLLRWEILTMTAVELATEQARAIERLGGKADDAQKVILARFEALKEEDLTGEA